MPGLKRQVEALGRQVVQVTAERDQLRHQGERHLAELTAERDARRAEREERQQREDRLQAIEALLTQLKSNAPAVEQP